jgi:hypothetical protein
MKSWPESNDAQKKISKNYREDRAEKRAAKESVKKEKKRSIKVDRSDVPPASPFSS